MTTFNLTAGADTFPGPGQDNSGDDIINGLAGADLIHCGTGNDLVNGGTERDRLFGDAGDDVMTLACCRRMMWRMAEPVWTWW